MKNKYAILSVATVALAAAVLLLPGLTPSAAEKVLLKSLRGDTPLTEEGALLIARYDRGLTLKLEVSRAGKRQKFTLKL